jgi:hypothetical protein
MARLACVAVHGHPQYLTQRVNRRQQAFFTDADYRPYKQLPTVWFLKEGRKPTKKDSQ